MSNADDIAKAYPRASSVASELVALARRLGADPAALANLIQFESGWRTTAENPYSGATGLIQFMPSTATSMGTTTAAIAKLGLREQLALVERYLKPYKGKLGTSQGLYMAVFYPKAMTWPSAQTFSALVQKSNPGIKTPADYVALVDRHAKLRTVVRMAARTGMKGWLIMTALGLAGLLCAWLLQKQRARKALAVVR